MDLCGCVLITQITMVMVASVRDKQVISSSVSRVVSRMPTHGAIDRL